MKLSINDDGGHVIGTLTTYKATLWIDLLLYASAQWEAQAALAQGEALAKLLRKRADAA